jgi:carbonic anhydrase
MSRMRSTLVVTPIVLSILGIGRLPAAADAGGPGLGPAQALAELIFDQGLGGLFVVRVAGNTVTRAGLESIDYAVTHLGTHLVMVLGHDGCGAVQGAIRECSGQPDAGRPEIFANICPAADLARKQDPAGLESKAIDLNVTEQVRILEQSPLLEKRVADGSLRIVGARYHLQSGKVELLDAGR